MHRPHKTFLCTLIALGAAGVGGATARADETTKPVAPPDPALGLDPTTPQVASLPGGTTPAYGQRALSEGEWRFDFHGFLTAPLAIGIGDRANPQPDQSGTVLHTPPGVCSTV